MVFTGTRLYYDEADGLPKDCIEIILFKALLELHFPRHIIQRFTHMFDCHNLYHTINPKIATDKHSNAKTPPVCTSVVQNSHIDYFQLMSSILSVDGKCNRESIFDNLPLSFVIGIDDVSLRFHTSLNKELLNNRIQTVCSIKGKHFNQAFNTKYPMTRIEVKAGHIVMFAGMM